MNIFSPVSGWIIACKHKRHTNTNKGAGHSVVNQHQRHNKRRRNKDKVKKSNWDGDKQ